jgi:DNA-directed RNA polymerase subunit beta
LIRNTLLKDPTHAEDEALKQIYSLLRPGDAPNKETARQALERLFFSPKRYDLGRVGRYKINQRLNLTEDAGKTVLTKEDFVAIIRYLVELHEGRGHTDDIDHLGNRRIRSVGELIANQFSVGLSRMARLVKERMSINTDPGEDLARRPRERAHGQRVIQAFFGSSQLSQFMDQTNPLAELTHKRRLSALGPGRSDARARGLRSPRRALLAVRPHVPDRDAGRSEHRPHHVARVLRARERSRVRRDAVP